MTDKDKGTSRSTIEIVTLSVFFNDVVYPSEKTIGGVCLNRDFIGLLERSC